MEKSIQKRSSTAWLRLSQWVRPESHDVWVAEQGKEERQISGIQLAQEQPIGLQNLFHLTSN